MKGYRTIIVNIVMAAAPLIDVIMLVLNLNEFRAIIPPQYMPFYALFMVLVNMFMRWVTTTPVGQKS